MSYQINNVTHNRSLIQYKILCVIEICNDWFECPDVLFVIQLVDRAKDLLPRIFWVNSVCWSYVVGIFLGGEIISKSFAIPCSWIPVIGPGGQIE